jgi:DNA-binding phage protein
MKKEKLKTTKWDVSDYLKTDEDMALILKQPWRMDIRLLSNPWEHCPSGTRSHKAGIGRVSLYKALSQTAPEFATVLRLSGHLVAAPRYNVINVLPQ